MALSCFASRSLNRVVVEGSLYCPSWLNDNDVSSTRDLMEITKKYGDVNILAAEFNEATSTVDVTYSNNSDTTSSDSSRTWKIPASVFSNLSNKKSAASSYKKVLWNAQHLDSHLLQGRRFVHTYGVSSNRDILSSLQLYGMTLVDGVDGAQETNKLLLSLFDSVHATHFGLFWSWESQGEFEDAAYGTQALPNHTDGTYYQRGSCPRLQVLHCLESAAKGGLNTMTDGYYIKEIIRTMHHEHFKTLCKTPITGEYKKDNVWLEATRPVIDRDGFVSYNPVDRRPLSSHLSGNTSAILQAYTLFGDLTMSTEAMATLALAPGRVMLFDNWRVLHGRTGFTGRRKMCGAYILDDYYQSALRKANLLNQDC
eukprot:PhF_6_TR10809/c0_g1_i1/m.17415/K00474/TMLHE; trimethyllysine dioxygenase